MKDRNNSLTVLVVSSLLLRSVCAEPNDEKIISFAIPVSDKVMGVLGDETGKRKRQVSEMLESVGIVFYPGSEVFLDKEEAKICGKLARSQARLVVELSQMLSDFTVEEIRLYFNPVSECFPPKMADTPGLDNPLPSPTQNYPPDKIP